MTLDAGTTVSEGDGRLRVAECIERYIQFLKMRRYSSRTIQGVARSLERFSRYLMRAGRGDVALAEVTAADLDAYTGYLRDYRGLADGKPLGHNVILARLLDVRRFFRYLVEEGVIVRSPAEFLQLGKFAEVAPRGLMTRDEVKAIMAQPDTSQPLGVRDRALLAVLYGCGLRAAELMALDTSDADLAKGFILVRCGKGAKDRVVPMVPDVAEWLERYLADVRPGLFRDGSTTALWLTTTGTRLGFSSLAQLVAKYKAAAGMKKAGAIHAFRHSIATHLLDVGLDLRYIQEFLGHEHIQTTERYTTVAVAGLAEKLDRHHPRACMKLALPAWPAS